MGHLSTDAVVTIVSTIPGLLVSCLSAWFAYLAVRRRQATRNDIEASTIEFIIAHINSTSPTSQRPLYQLTAEAAVLTHGFPQLPPVPHENENGVGRASTINTVDTQEPDELATIQNEGNWPIFAHQARTRS